MLTALKRHVFELFRSAIYKLFFDVKCSLRLLVSSSICEIMHVILSHQYTLCLSRSLSVYVCITLPLEPTCHFLTTLVFRAHCQDRLIGIFLEKRGQCSEVTLVEW